jgi:hypothetical protein
LQAGTPLQLSNTQQLKGIDLRLPRGSVISGHVFDENGEPAPGTSVQVLQYRYIQGSRQLVPAGSAQADDRGQYRIWGLNPGTFYVSAVARNVNLGGRGGQGGGPTAPFGRGGQAPPGQPESEAPQVGYAPTYYPGVGAAQDAAPVTVGLSAEAPGVDFKLLLVRTARVEGRILSGDGEAGRGNVVLVPEGRTGRGFGPGGGNFAGNIQRDGAFRIANVPPGRYTLRARSVVAELAHYASEALTVGEDGTQNLTVVLAPGATVSGTVSFEGGTTPDISPFRVTAAQADASGFGQNSSARVESDHRFLIVEIPPGPFFFRTQQPRGWSLKSVTMNGRDVADTPIELRSGQKAAGVSIVFTDRIAEINGTVTDQTQAPVTDYTILAFPTDATLWRPQARHILTARPDQTGAFQIRGLPPGEYYVAAVDPAEQGEWFEPSVLDQYRIGAARLTLQEGDVRTQNFTIAVRNQ